MTRLSETIRGGGRPPARTRSEVREILDYKRKLQAYIIHFERVNHWDMVQKLHDADDLLDRRLREILPRFRSPQPGKVSG